uniref:Uncharacterized protein n=1 Tax=Arcella intermedia TaxID=1963864 RepID=A0A6B2LAH4_9EUKA
MMMIWSVFVSLLLFSVVRADRYDDEAAWNQFKKDYQKEYSNPIEEQNRFNIFKDNLHFVSTWDHHSKGFSLAMNRFGDLTGSEFANLFLRSQRNEHRNASLDTLAVSPAVPASLDWRTKGAVGPVKDQGQCGASWPFVVTGAVEGAWFIAGHRLVQLSEQNLIDCAETGGQGCTGGFATADTGFQYIINNHGIDTSASYPPDPNGSGPCRFTVAGIGATISSYVDTTSGDENALLLGLNKGPVSVVVDASQASFQFYSGGVYDEPACSSVSVDHDMLAVGYGNLNGVDYWIVKNSWGTSWGDAGYILMSRNKNNQCGIATDASYPVV